jgi:hypothetical protein
MASEVQMIGYELIKTGKLVSFHIIEEEVLAAPDEAEFGMRLLLRFVAEETMSRRTPPSGVISGSFFSGISLFGLCHRGPETGARTNVLNR